MRCAGFHEARSVLAGKNPSRCLLVAIARPQHCARKGAEFSFRLGA